MESLLNFEREMKAKARKETNPAIRERRLTSALLARNLQAPVNDQHRDDMVASLRRQAQGGGQ